MTKIEWTDETWNPIIGCRKISPGCQNCYAEKMAFRLGHGQLSKNEGLSLKYSRIIDCNSKTWNGRSEIIEESMIRPMKWKKPKKIFVCSMGDLFHESVSFKWIDEVIKVIKQCPQHTFQILTKRPDRMLEYFKNYYQLIPRMIRNIWLGVTAENQEQANFRIPILLEIPSIMHFISIEPMVASVNMNEIGFHKFKAWLSGSYQYSIKWVICGGETGQNARPLHPDWVINLKNNCVENNIPFFFKSWGEYWPCVSGRIYREKTIDFIDGVSMAKVGKKLSGCMIEGKEYKQFPKI
jgi:protein gp37